MVNEFLFETVLTADLSQGLASRDDRQYDLYLSYELRKLAVTWMTAEVPDNTPHATALVHEAYLRLVGQADADRWDNRGHFFAAAGEAMRRVLSIKPGTAGD